jgi:antitoxin MazE
MKTKIVRIGNSRGLRLPRHLLEEAKLTEEVEVVARNGSIVISSSRHPRAGWAEAGKLAHARGEDKLLDPPSATRFDDEEWEW